MRALKLAILILFAATGSSPAQDLRDKDPLVSKLIGEALNGSASALRRLHAKASEGSVLAQAMLGYMYENARSVPKNLPEAERWYRRAAEQGNPHAQEALGHLYADGQNYVEATRWYLRAAEQGSSRAQGALGVAYLSGLGVPQNYAEAARWFRLAADQGIAAAQLQIGGLYVQGNGVTQDYSEGARWYRKAAEQGHSDAQYYLGNLYILGKGVTQDPTEAARWHKRAAEQGNAFAQFRLGEYYSKGAGVVKDPVTAYMWLNLAAATGQDQAGRSRDLLEKTMSAEQIAQGQTLSRMWKPNLEGQNQNAARSSVTSNEAASPRGNQQKPRDNSFGDALIAIGVEMMRQSGARAEANRTESVLGASCGIKPIETKPLQLGCRDMVQTCSCTSNGSCRWLWTCVP